MLSTRDSLAMLVLCAVVSTARACMGITPKDTTGYDITNCDTNYPGGIDIEDCSLSCASGYHGSPLATCCTGICSILPRFRFSGCEPDSTSGHLAHQGNGNQDSICTEDRELAFVRCCSDHMLANAGWVQNSGCSVWGGSDEGFDCSGSKTYAEATVFCAEQGARLCSVEEIKSQCTKATGCNYDYKMVWTSSECEWTTPAPWPKRWATTAHGDMPTYCMDNALTPVRCCSDHMLADAGWIQNSGCSVWVALVEGYTCDAYKNYDDALAFCAELGARLCSFEEVRAHCADTGCSSDSGWAWTSSECDVLGPSSTPAPTPAPGAPTPAPPTSASHLGHTGNGNFESICIENGDYLLVRCCSDHMLADAGWIQNSGCSVWGGSDEGFACSGYKTYDEATVFCAEQGARLCSVEEIEGQCAKGTGCSYDNKMVWTLSACEVSPSTPAPPTPSPLPPTGLYWTHNGNGNLNSECTADDELSLVRCCSDSDLSSINSGWKKIGDCSVWGGSDEGFACSGDKSFDEADAYCKEQGSRLCTLDEIKSQCTKGTGCSYDNQKVWTSTACESGSRRLTSYDTVRNAPIVV